MRQSRKSSVLKELVALGLFIDGTSRPIAKDLVTLSPSAGGRYSLRLRDQFHKVVRPVGVTKPKRKARSSGFSKSREGYNGPGYQEVRGRRQFPEDQSLKGCNHESNICRICIARHTETQLAVDGKWRRVNCLQCQTKLSKDQVCKLIWRDDFER
ncbi:MAG: hypothetical protein L6R38_009047 [Xanthoria sp. 2 TBL-2021]|nr:MAG: hypothetical protein L6R38_009047 [Xanthoria sp. 2 TBL-2021]